MGTGYKGRMGVSYALAERVEDRRSALVNDAFLDRVTGELGVPRVENQISVYIPPVDSNSRYKHKSRGTQAAEHYRHDATVRMLDGQLASLVSLGVPDNYNTRVILTKGLDQTDPLQAKVAKEWAEMVKPKSASH